MPSAALCRQQLNTCSFATKMALQHAWFSGKHGSLAGIQQAKLWALREVLSKQGESTTQWQWMSEQVSLATSWLALFKADKLRYPISVVMGASMSGKTEFAKSLSASVSSLRLGSL